MKQITSQADLKWQRANKRWEGEMCQGTNESVLCPTTCGNHLGMKILGLTQKPLNSSTASFLLHLTL